MMRAIRSRKTKGETMATEQRWDVAYEWKAILIMSLAFGLVGIDRFILPPLFIVLIGPAALKVIAVMHGH